MFELDAPMFGRIKNVYNTILTEGILEKDAKKKELFKKYVKTIKENEILKTQFLVFDNIENKIESDFNKAMMFVKENLSLLSKYKPEDIHKANEMLVSEGMMFNTPVEDDELYININTLMFAERNPHSIDIIVEATNAVVNHILNNKPKVTSEALDFPSSALATLLVEKYNQKYSEIDESEKQVLRVLIESTDEEKKTVYSNILRECIVLIDENLNTTDLDAKDKLLRVKDRLLNDKQEINEDFIKNISKLVELRGNLKNTK